MRKLLVIVLTVELLIAVLIGQTGHWHRRDFDQAVYAWYKNPTAENRAELDSQKRVNELERVGFSAVAFGGMTVVTLLGGYAYGRRLRRVANVAE